MIKGKTQKF